jgi:hypothetical protein
MAANPFVTCPIYSYNMGYMRPSLSKAYCLNVEHLTKILSSLPPSPFSNESELFHMLSVFLHMSVIFGEVS